MMLSKAALLIAGNKVPTEPGKAFGGGYYAGKIQIAGVQYALVIAPLEAETSARGASNTVSTAFYTVNDGAANNLRMVTDGSPAAIYCANYRGSGFADWYLPSRDELELCYRNLKPSTEQNTLSLSQNPGGHGANTNSVPAGAAYTANLPLRTAVALFQSTGAQRFNSVSDSIYWTSTPYNNDYVLYQSFQNGAQNIYTPYNTTCRVRPMRKVRIS